MTLLHKAAKKGNLGFVQWLFRQGGADLDLPGPRGYTALHFAVEGKHDKVAQWLLEEGVDVNAATSDSVTPLQMAVWNNDSLSAKLLLDNDAEINKPGWETRRAIHYAVVNADTEMWKLLCRDPNIDINAKDAAGATALDWAKKHSNDRAEKILRSYGAKHGDSPKSDNDASLSSSALSVPDITKLTHKA